MKRTKKALSVLLSLLMVFSTMVCAMTAVSFTASAAWGGTFPTSAPTGWSVSGTSYYISTPEALAYLMRTIANGTNYGGNTVYLTADIDLGGTKSFSMGSSYRTNAFCGTFDGQGHTINKLYINGTWDNVGFFMRTANSATIKNVTFNNPKIVNSGASTSVVVGNANGSIVFNNVHIIGTPTATTNGACNVNGANKQVGAFVGAGNVGNSNSSFTNCSSSASVYGGNAHVGGYWGVESSDYLITFSGCTHTGNVTAPNGAATGGYIGATYGAVTMTNCSNTGVIAGSSEAGGLVGYLDDDPVKLTKCKNTGKITSSTKQAGGLIGYCDDGASFATNSYNTGAVNGKGDSGGLVGESYGKMTYTQSFNTGSVTSQSNSAGGIAGRSDSQSTFNYCYNGGYIKGVSDRAAGICAFFDGTKPIINSCYVYGGYSGVSNANVFYSTNNATVTNCYCLNTVNASPLQGTAVPAATLNAAAMPGALGSTVYCQDTWGVNSKYPIHQWYRATLNFSLSFNANGGSCSTTSVSGLYGTAKTLPTPTRTGYTFNGWYTAASGGTKIGNAGASITLGTTAPTNTSLTGGVLYAQWTPITYTITFKDYNGTTLKASQVNHGTTPTCTAPTRAADAQYTYAFKAWSPTVVAATAAATYTATYTSTLRAYNITFNNDDGTQLQSSNWNYGTTPTCTTPTKASTAQYSYTFAGWSPAVTSVTEAKIYTATYNQTERSYSVTFKNADGTELQSSNWTYGTTPVYSGATPEKAEDAQYTYTFSGWSPIITTVADDAIYIAQFSSAKKSYNVTFKNGDNVLQSSNVEYGETPSYMGATPTKDTTAEFTYEFAGWSPSISAVTGAQTYVAQFTSTKRSYTVEFKNGDTVLQSSVLAYGATPSYGEATPTKASTNEYTYTFNGWSPAIATVTGNATYVAQFTENPIDYTVAVSAGTGITAITGNKTCRYNDSATVTATVAPNYSFLGWFDAGDNCVSTATVYTFNVTANVTLIAKALINTYSVKFVNYNGDLLHTASSVGGETVGYPFPAPTREDDGEFTYSFSEWCVAAEGEGACTISGNTISNVTRDVILIANYTGTTKTYTVEYRNNNGETICTVTNLPYGTSISEAYTKADPEIPDAGGVSYTFAGWDRTVVNGNMTAVALYRASNVTSYWVTFNDEDGTTLYRSLVNAGGTATYEGATPTKAADEEYIYTFSHWSGNITNIQANTAVSAVYTATANQYANCDHENVSSVDTQADCTHPATTVYTCADCGYSWRVETEQALGHEWNAGEVTTQATCTEDGVKTYTCSRCDDTYTEAIPAFGHTEETIPAVEPTCTETGLTEGVKCSVCGDIITAQTVVDALGHDWDDGVVTTEATCTEDGVMTFTCQREGCAETKTEAISATGHTEVADAAVPATCTESGLTEGSHCSVCGEIIIAQVETTALGHNYVSEVTTEATCATAGVKTFTCSRCNDTYTEAIPATGEHTWEVTSTVAATCHTYSVTDYKCSVCDETKTVTGTEYDADNHDGETEVRDAVAATCGTAGYTGDTYCLGCEAKIADGEVIAATGAHAWTQTAFTAATCHTYSSTEYECEVCDATKTEAGTEYDAANHDGGTQVRDALEATCTEDGYTGDTYCLGCGAKLESGTVIPSAAVEHEWVYDSEFAATCHTYAGTVYKCSVCNTTKTEYGTEYDATNHDGETEVRDDKAATCVENGYTGDTYCLGCGEKIATGTAIPASAEYHAWTVIGETAATCHTYSVTNYKCSVCDETKTVTGTEYDAANHDGETEVRDAADAACEADGYTGDTYCLGCNTKIATGTVITALGHTWEETSAVAATCHNYAVTNYKCSVCDETKTVTGTEYDADNHDGETEVRDALAATCGTAGYTGDTYCLGCDTKIATGEAIAATGEHDWDETSSTSATCHSYAVTDYKCSVCDETKTVTGTEYDAANHDGETEVRDALAATCGTAGYTGDTYCLGCDTKIATGEVIAATGEHAWEVTSTVEATCHSYAVTEYKCSVCDETKTVTGTEYDAANHDGDTEVRFAKAATCGAAGYTGNTYCKGCDAILVTGEAIPATGAHNWTETSTTPANCHEYSMTYCECAVCHKTKTIEGTKLDAANHDGETEIRNATSATCTADGYTGDTYCLGCGAKIKTGTAIPSGAELHKWVQTGATAATCHTYSATQYECSVCKETKTEYGTEYDFTNHDGETEIRNKKAATCGTEGNTGDTYCLGCNTMITAGKVIPVTNRHKYVASVSTATCTVGGYTTYTCSVCGDSYTDEYTEATGHQWGNWIITKPAVSCVVSGIQSRTCAICGKIESDNYYIEHTPSAENPNTCSVCGKTIDNSGTGGGSHMGGDTDTGTCGCCDKHNHDKTTIWGWIQCLICRFAQMLNFFKNIKNV